MGKKHFLIPEPKLLQQRIPGSVALINDPKDYETLQYHLSFEFYKEKLCEIDLLEKNGAKRALHNIKTIGLSNRKSLGQNGIDSFPIENSGEYSSLYNKLPPDADLKEHKIQGTARIFYFTVNRLFHIVCIKNSHFETKKHR